MEQVTLKNYRCFRQEQTARLGRLTLLVGENSTGKTSFLAILRALWSIAYHETLPNFREPPYDLGGFREIAHHRGAKGSAATTFSAGFTTAIDPRSESKNDALTFAATFARHDTAPFPTVRRLSSSHVWVEHHSPENGRKMERQGSFIFGTPRGSWQLPLADNYLFVPRGYLLPLDLLPHMDLRAKDVKPCNGTTVRPSKTDSEALRDLVWSFQRHPRSSSPYAGAPVRSRPLRTYESITSTPDPEGEYIPPYLANISSGDSASWESLKSALEAFGRLAGLFNEIDVKLLSKADGGPFALQLRKFGRRLKGPRRNLADLGYGVSQVLPIITELLKPNSQPMYLLQQPEVHLHPSAQASLGTLLCSVAAQGSAQLFIETHSDHLLNRIRMDVRDGRTELRPDEVSILYFEPNNLDVRIHSLRIDGEGNVLHAPKSYRRFFLQETQRSLGL